MATLKISYTDMNTTPHYKALSHLDKDIQESYKHLLDKKYELLEKDQIPEYDSDFIKVKKRFTQLSELFLYLYETVTETDAKNYLDFITYQFQLSLPSLDFLKKIDSIVINEDQYISREDPFRKLVLKYISPEKAHLLLEELRQHRQKAMHMLHLIDTVISISPSSPILHLEREYVAKFINQTLALSAVMERTSMRASPDDKLTDQDKVKKIQETDNLFFKYTTLTSGEATQEQMKTTLQGMVALLKRELQSAPFDQEQRQHIIGCLKLLFPNHEAILNTPQQGKETVVDSILDQNSEVANHVFNDKEQLSFFQKVGERHNIAHFGWKVEQHSKDTMKVVPTKSTIYSATGRNVSGQRLFELYYHEFGTHMVRGISGQITTNHEGRRIAMLGKGLDGYLNTEESLAAYNEAKTRLTNASQSIDVFTYAIRLYASYKMVHSSDQKWYRTLDKELKDLFVAREIMKSPSMSLDEALHIGARESKSLLIRVTRGTSGTTPGAGYAKDYVYIARLKEIEEYIRKNPENEKYFYLGKIDLNHIPILRRLGFEDPAIVNPCTLEEFMEVAKEVINES